LSKKKGNTSFTVATMNWLTVTEQE